MTIPADPPAGRSGGHHVSGRGSILESMGNLITPRSWCRQPWCRQNETASHHPGDGCTCDAHGQAVPQPLRKVRLRTRAARLDAFACRACGAKTRDMVEGPFVYFRCEPCATADRWPAPAVR
jgi:hypothetical protein